MIIIEQKYKDKRKKGIIILIIWILNVRQIKINFY